MCASCDQFYIDASKHHFNTETLIDENSDKDPVDNDCNSINSESENAIDESEYVLDLDEMLISEVEKRPELYNYKLPITQRSKPRRDLLWNEIHEALNKILPITDLQKKWKSIRDRFIRNRNEITKYTPSGSGAQKKPPLYKFHNELQFLIDLHKPTKTVSNVPPQQLQDEQIPIASSQVDGKVNTPPSKRRKVSEASDLEKLLIERLSKPSPKPSTAISTNESTDSSNLFCAPLAEGMRKLDEETSMALEIDFMVKLKDVLFK